MQQLEEDISASESLHNSNAAVVPPVPVRPQNERCPFYLYYTFLWMSPYIARIKKQRKVEMDSIPPLPGSMNYTKALAKMEKHIYEGFLNSDASRRGIGALIMRLSWPHLALSLFLVSIISFLFLMQPLTMSAILHILDTEHIEDLRRRNANLLKELFSETWPWIMIAFFAQIMAEFLQSIITTVCAEQTIKLSQAFNILLYKKLLQISNVTATHVLSPIVVNFICSDARSASNLVKNFPQIATIPVKIAMVVIFIASKVDPSALAGLGGILITIPFIALLVVYNFFLEKRHAIQRDARVQFASELVIGMRVVKAYNYQSLCEKRMNARRRPELLTVGKITLAQSCIRMVGYMTWPAMLLCAFLSMIRTGQFTNTNAYTVAYLFNTFVRVVVAAPYLVASMTSTFVSCNRIKQFLSLPEHNETAYGNVGKSLIVNQTYSDKQLLNAAPPSASSPQPVIWTVNTPSYSWGKKEHRAIPSSFNTDRISVSKLQTLVDTFTKRRAAMFEKYNAALQLLSTDDLMPFFDLDTLDAKPAMNTDIYRTWAAEFGIPYDAGSSLARLQNVINKFTVPPTDSLLLQVKCGYLLVALLDKCIELAQIALSMEDADLPIILKSLQFSISRGSLVGIGGSVGSGKTSLLLAIIGNLSLECAKQDKPMGIYYTGRIAYCPQVPAIFTGTIAFNIQMFAPYDDTRMKLATKLSQLDDDLAEMPLGLSTLVGSRGVTLSGGQKARISLARALYSDADIYLLDEIFASLDAHVSKLVWTGAIMDFLMAAGKTVVFATNNINYFQHCTTILYIDNGVVKEIACDEMCVKSEVSSATVLQTTEDTIEKQQFLITNQLSAQNQKNDTDCQEQHAELGSVNAKYYKVWFKAGGQWKFVLYVTMWVLCIMMLQLASLLINFWTERRLDLSEAGYIGLFLGFSFAFMLLLFHGQLFYMLFSRKAASNLYDDMVSGLINTTMSFYDTSPFGRILNRLTADTGTCDLTVKEGLATTCENAIYVAGSLLAIVLMSWPSIAVLVPLLLIFTWMFTSFRSVAPLMRRSTSLLNSFVLNFILDSYANLSSIKAYACEKRAVAHYAKTVTALEAAFWMDVALCRWLYVVTALLSTFLFPAITVSAIVISTFGAGVVVSGTVLLNCFDVVMMLIDMCFGIIAMDISMTSVERVTEYAQLKPEATELLYSPEKPPYSTYSTEDTASLHISNLSLRYRQGLPVVLHNVNLTLNKGESLAIVGRTGSGKSSLINVLLRLVNPEPGASIVLNGTDLLQLPLSDARSRFAFISQDPFIFSGSLRAYLTADFNTRLSDEELWRVLEKVHLRDWFERQPMQLEFPLSDNGANLSLGQRQLLSVAHALLKESEIILLDEATAHIDRDSEIAVQEALQVFRGQKSIIAIAHRLRTVCSFDRVIVMANGHIVEQGTPQELFMQQTSAFASLVRHSENADELAEILASGR